MNKLLAKKYLNILIKYNLNAHQGLSKLKHINNIDVNRNLTKFWKSLGLNNVSGFCCLDNIYVANIKNFKKIYGEFLKKVL